jgi:predicted metal-binding membrane protein
MPHEAVPASGPVWDRATVLTGAALVVVAAVAWAGVLGQGATMAGDAMDAGMEMDAPAVGLAPAAAFVAAWAVMMAAMMVPSAIPMIALYGAVHRNNGASGQPGVPTAVFALTYLVGWAAIGLPVYLAGAAVAAIAPPMLLPYGIALVLLAAGAYQFTALKAVCLRACRGPLGFLIGHWRAGRVGAVRLGLAHAAYCVGCCWALMIVLVAAGAMGLAWVASIALAVFAEKVLPRGEWTARAIGVGLIALGVLVLAQPGLAAMLRGAAM